MLSVTVGNSKVEFSVWEINGRYQGRINDIVIYESQDYEAVRLDLLFDVGGNHFDPFNLVH